jgi:hypothetical protein
MSTPISNARLVLRSLLTCATIVQAHMLRDILTSALTISLPDSLTIPLLDSLTFSLSTLSICARTSRALRNRQRANQLHRAGSPDAGSQVRKGLVPGLGRSWEMPLAVPADRLNEGEKVLCVRNLTKTSVSLFPWVKTRPIIGLFRVTTPARLDAGNSLPATPEQLGFHKTGSLRYVRRPRRRKLNDLARWIDVAPTRLPSPRRRLPTSPTRHPLPTRMSPPGLWMNRGSPLFLPTCGGAT